MAESCIVEVGDGEVFKVEAIMFCPKRAASGHCEGWKRELGVIVFNGEDDDEVLVEFYLGGPYLRIWMNRDEARRLAEFLNERLG